MLNQILEIIWPTGLDQIRAHVRRPDLDVVEVPKPDKAPTAILPDVDNRVRVHTVAENEAGALVDEWVPEDAETRRIPLTREDLEELAVRGLGDQDKVKIAAYIKGMVYAGKSRREIVREHPTDRFPGFSDGNIGKIMAALNAVRHATPTPNEGRG